MSLESYACVSCQDTDPGSSGDSDSAPPSAVEVAESRRPSRYEPLRSNPTTPNDAYGGTIPSEHFQTLSETLAEEPRGENVGPGRVQRPSIIRTPLGEFPDGVLKHTFSFAGKVKRRGLIFSSPIE